MLRHGLRALPPRAPGSRGLAYGGFRRRHAARARAAVPAHAAEPRCFGVANTAVERLLAFSRDGASFVFGRLATDPQSFGFIFAVQVLPTILFFSALMSVLYHLRVMPFLVERGGRFSRACSARAGRRASRPWQTSSSGRRRLRS